MKIAGFKGKIHSFATTFVSFRLALEAAATQQQEEFLDLSEDEEVWEEIPEELTEEERLKKMDPRERVKCILETK